MKYAEASKTWKPIAVIKVPVSVWAQSWDERPTEETEIGFRSLSELELSEIEALARHRASASYPHGSERDALWAAEFMRHMVAHAVARALCRPESAAVLWFEYPDLVALRAFTPEGAAWLYARFEAACIAASPLVSDESPAALVVALGGLGGAVESLTPARRSQVARHLRAALDAAGA